MRLEVSRVDRDLPLPEYKTPGSVAFDLLVRVGTVVRPQSLATIPVNLIVRIPAGYMLVLAARSSTPRKKGLLTPHGIGIIDQDYRGPQDELGVQVHNFTDKPITVGRGERIAQALLVPIARCELVEVELAGQTSRGGFGSTG